MAKNKPIELMKSQNVKLIEEIKDLHSTISQLINENKKQEKEINFLVNEIEKNRKKQVILINKNKKLEIEHRYCKNKLENTINRYNNERNRLSDGNQLYSKINYYENVILQLANIFNFEGEILLEKQENLKEIIKIIKENTERGYVGL